MDSKALLEKILASIGEHKAESVAAFDVREVVTYTDFVVVCSGQNSRQVAAIADDVAHDLKAAGIMPIGIEGKSEGDWVLLDYGDVVVHVFDEPVRDFYDLEAMWRDAPRMPVPESLRAAAGAYH